MPKCGYCDKEFGTEEELSRQVGDTHEEETRDENSEHDPLSEVLILLIAILLIIASILLLFV